MNKDFKDHFSGHARDYGHYRPLYPQPLFAYLATLTGGHKLAWDCATGTGQAAASLTPYYQQVVATDASAEQIAQAVPVAGVAFRCATAENSLLADNSVDLVTVAQALHWFDLPAFALEVERVLVDDGVLAVWTYGLMHINEELDALIQTLYRDTLGPYWPFERRMVENAYADIALPFEIIAAPVFEMTMQWELAQVIGYLNTWSAVKRYEAGLGVNPVQRIVPQLEKLWGDTGRKYKVGWPLGLRLWRKEL